MKPNRDKILDTTVEARGLLDDTLSAVKEVRERIVDATEDNYGCFGAYSRRCMGYRMGNPVCEACQELYRGGEEWS